MKKWMLVLSLTALTAICGTALGTPIGVRVGYTDWDNVSQMHFGAHAKTGELFPNVDFTPGLEMGFGDDITIMTFNGDLAYKFTELMEAPWGLYAGGSLSLNYLNPRHLESDIHLGLSGLLGFTRLLSGGDELMLEARFGILDSPDFKITFGYTFF